MDLSVIIVNYKTPEKVTACIDSIKNSDTGDLDLEIIVVDNKSNDDSEEIILRKHPDIKFIKSERNLGMGGGNNLGARNSKGEFVLILNPDTLIKKDSICKLYKHIKENEEVGAVGPKLLNPDKTLQYSCRRFPKALTPVFRRTFLKKIARSDLDNFLMKDFDHSITREVDWMLGSCLMVDLKAFESRDKIFDDKFFMYFEDTDLCRRVKKNNFKVVYLPEAVVIHDHTRESALKPWYISPFVDKLTREHIKSWIKYFCSGK